jgi:peptide/nickel transport system permease protein
VIVALTLEYLLICVLFWDLFSLWAWSTFFGLVLVQICAFALVRYWTELRHAPPTAWFGLVVILIYVMIAATAPIIAPFGETEIVGSEYDPWGDKFLMGTDNLGRDMLTRLVYGARNTVGVAFVTTVLAFVLGGFAGLLAATLRGWVDQALGRLVDVLMAIPSLIFGLLLLTIFGTSILSLIIVIAVLDSTRVFRLARAVAMNVVVLEFVEAANLRGEGLLWIIRREILPNIMPPLVAEFGLRFCFVFLFISALSFLGLGIKPPTADWGSMVRDNATLITFGDITPLIPAAAIALLTVGVNFVVDWFLHKASGLKE